MGYYRLLHGDVLDVLRSLEARSVHLVVTSPPYYAMRDYGDVTGRWWPERPDCWQPYPHEHRGSESEPTLCMFCGAWFGGLGQEPTPEMYVQHLVHVFREIKRVLRDDGSVWLNLGDTYAAGGRGPGGSRKQDSNRGSVSLGRRSPPAGTKPRDLLLIPSEVARALRADGWGVWSDVVWHKPNGYPSSVKDRPARNHEMIWLLTKGPKQRFWTHRFGKPGMRSRPRPDHYWLDRLTGSELHRPPEGHEGIEAEIDGSTRKRYQRRNAWRGHHYYFDMEAVLQPLTTDEKRTSRIRYRGKSEKTSTFIPPNPNGKHIRSVLSVPSASYKGAHFAVMPAGIVEPWVKAGTSERGVCPACGAPWTRVTRICDPRPPRCSTAEEQADWNRQQGFPGGTGCIRRPGGNVGTRRTTETTGWTPSCGCLPHRSPEPAVVLDPFCGSGTVGVAALSLGRSFIGIDANPDYLGLADQRLHQALEEHQPHLFARDEGEPACQSG